MKTIEVELVLMKYFEFKKNLVVPNLTNMCLHTHFEIDMFCLTKSGYATGVEIKVTKADLKKDLQKSHIIECNQPNRKEFYFGKLKYFYYAVPEELIEIALKQIPSFCGLLVLNQFTDVYGESSIYLKTVRYPEQIGKYKWSEKERVDILRLAAMRIYNLKKNIEKLTKTNKKK